MNDKPKSRKVGYHYTLKTPQYGNCEVLGPDGNLMFRCGRKKAFWYLNRNLAKKLKEDPLTVQLTFIPKGVGHVNDPYFLQKMENRCVVCGSQEDLTRHHVVPYCYRKFFPSSLKDHKGYDVMALCIPCHHKYEDYALEFKENLAVRYNAPVSGQGAKFNKTVSVARGTARAILEHGDKIPQPRKDELIQRLKDYFQRDYNEEDLRALLDKKPYDFGNYVHHGEIIIEQVDIGEFVQEWRQHFLDKMSPRFLPSNWTIHRPVDYK